MRPGSITPRPTFPADTELLPRISGQDGKLRVAHDGELDIFGPDVPGYDPEHPLYLGGEGMLQRLMDMRTSCACC